MCDGLSRCFFPVYKRRKPACAPSFKNMGPVFHFFEFLKGIFFLLKETVLQCWRKPFYGHIIIRNMYDFGIRSFFIIVLLGVSLGGVLTYHIGMSIEKYGAKLYVPKVLSLAVLGEFAPTLGAIILAGRIGAGITAEIGAMRVTEQIDALRALGVSYIKYLTAPKILACLIIIPALCLWMAAVCLLTGAYIGYTLLKLDPGYFIAKALYTPPLAFFVFSCFKTVVFALFISLIACHYGLSITKGAYEVGSATMKSVVASLIAIILSDFALTRFYYDFLHHW